MSLPTREEVCSNLINIIKDHKNVTFKVLAVDPTYFMSPEERDKILSRGPVGFRGSSGLSGLSGTDEYKKFIENEIKIIKSETVIEITLKVPKILASKRYEIAKGFRRTRLTECILYEEKEIVKRSYFAKVLSAIKEDNPSITADDLLYLPNDNKKEINPLFGCEKTVAWYDPY